MQQRALCGRFLLTNMVSVLTIVSIPAYWKLGKWMFDLNEMIEVEVPRVLALFVLSCRVVEALLLGSAKFGLPFRARVGNC